MMLLFEKAPITITTKNLIINHIKVVKAVTNLATHLLLMINILLRDLFHQDIQVIVAIILDILNNFNKVMALKARTSSQIALRLKINK